MDMHPPGSLAFMLFGESEHYYMGVLLTEKGNSKSRRRSEIRSLWMMACHSGLGSQYLSILGPQVFAISP
jgi:hypothetical protein